MSPTSIVPSITATRDDVLRSRSERIIPALTRLLFWPLRVVKARAELAKLAALSDHELRDVGLSRQDLRDATALALDEDPTRHLARTVGRRRPGRAR